MPPQTPDPAETPFFGWRVVGAAFVVALFGWGVGFYGPPVYLHVVQERRGWSVALVSAAVTAHFLFGAAAVANLARLHRRFGLVAVTRAGGVAAAVGLLGWALAAAPWQLFAATALTGFGWAATGGAAINAMVAPWFVRRRPAALSMAYNGASAGGVLLTPIWVALIAAAGFAGAAALVGAAMAVVLWWIAGRFLAPTPASLGQHPDHAAGGTARPLGGHAAPPGASLWRERRFLTLAAGNAVALFAQIGLIAHLFSLLVPPLGAALAGIALSVATAAAIAGRSLLGWLMPPEADRRRAAAANLALQVLGCLVLLGADGAPVPLLLGVALFGLALGNVTTLPPLIAQQDFAPADTARIVALVTATGQAVYAFAPALFGLLRQFEASGGALFLAAAAAQAIAAALLLAGRRAASC
jgi:hypothetical protein